ncbi:flagellar operon protein [Halobacteroides halobius DSM 5150]|uniref:Flagellar operon protein n=1 Tax=Halobacteroides halobius (strain ATCC 35273 / DSM 5150 / MD-1) TaxID=748449 RepID=L0K933_HALHC|nr:TIGR02530 family flagellar biosynthesis protein [Halobacteroides halobius]AGB40633.1 flagellar operon protein [Halobacteroides halobius DSM 5150]
MTKIYSNQPLVSSTLKYKQSDVDSQKSFKEILSNKKDNKLQFSKHAKMRLQSRELNLKQNDLSKLEEAVDKAKEKGAQESLVLVSDNAYIVSIENDTVITALGKEDMKENIVTNIDSAIMMK